MVQHTYVSGWQCCNIHWDVSSGECGPACQPHCVTICFTRVYKTIHISFGGSVHLFVYLCLAAGCVCFALQGSFWNPFDHYSSQVEDLAHKSTRIEIVLLALVVDLHRIYLHTCVCHAVRNHAQALSIFQCRPEGDPHVRRNSC